MFVTSVFIGTYFNLETAMYQIDYGSICIGKDCQTKSAFKKKHVIYYCF